MAGGAQEKRKGKLGPEELAGPKSCLELAGLDVGQTNRPVSWVAQAQDMRGKKDMTGG